MRNITAKHRAAEKHNFEEFLKGAKKSFQEKVSGAREEK